MNKHNIKDIVQNSFQVNNLDSGSNFSLQDYTSDSGVLALRSGTKYTINNIAYNFNTSDPMSENAKDAAREIFQHIDDLTNSLNFTEVTSTNANINFYTEDLPTGIAGVASYPYRNSSYIKIDDKYFNSSFNKGRFEYKLMLHEIGHAIGLQHPHDGITLPVAEDSQNASVMSYYSSDSSSVGGAVATRGGSTAPWTYQIYDVAELQYLYGVGNDYSNGNDTYTYDGIVNHVYTLWDGGGVDTIDASGHSGNAIITLQEGLEYVTHIGKNKIWNAFGSSIENATGGTGADIIDGNSLNNILVGGDGNDIIEGREGNDSIYSGNGNDIIYGNDGNDYLEGNAGDDTILAGNGDDILIGGTGNDTLYGNGGNDTFIIILDSGSVDTIHDFDPNQLDEKVDLSALDSIITDFDSMISDADEILNDVVLNFAGGQKVIIKNIGLSDLQPLHFIGNASIIDNTPTSIDILNFDNEVFTSYGVNQNVSDVFVTEDGGKTLKLSQNTWKAIDYDYTVTSETVLEFDFKSTYQGEIQGVGFDNDNIEGSSYFFQLYGTQDWGISDYRTYESGDGWKHYVINVGDNYTGDFSKILFINDHDVSAPNADSFFSNVAIYDKNKPYALDMDDFAISGYVTGQNVSDIYSVEDDGATLHLSENSWQKIDYDYSVTSNTVIEFEFKSNMQGDIHGIGFDNDNHSSSNLTFEIYGTQSWGIQDYNNSYVGNEGEWVKYSINVGSHYTGEFTDIFFVNDHDVATPNAESFFRNITVYETNGIYGNDADDILYSTFGEDYLSGGGGQDTFVFDNLTDSNSVDGIDIIADFEDGVDLIDLQGLVVSGVISDFNDLNITNDGTDTTVASNNGSNFKIELSGVINLDQTDFLL